MFFGALCRRVQLHLFPMAQLPHLELPDFRALEVNILSVRVEVERWSFNDSVLSKDTEKGFASIPKEQKNSLSLCVFQRETLFFDSLMQADFNCNFLKLIICGISYIYDDFYLIFPGKKYILQMIFHGIVLLWDMCYLTTVIFQQIRWKPAKFKKSFAIILGEMYPVRLCLYILPGAFRHDDSGLLAGPST